MEHYQKINSVCLLLLTFIAMAIVFSITKSILVPFTLSIFAFFIFSPPMNLLQIKYKLPKWLVLSLTMILLIGSFILISILIATSVDSFIHGADQYKGKMEQFAVQVSYIAKNLGFEFNADEIRNLLQKLPVMDFIKKITASMLAILSNSFLVVIFTLFLLTGESVSKNDIPIIGEIKNNASKYVGTKLFTSGTTAIISFIVFKIFGVEMAFMFAMLTFLLNFIPTVGSIIAVILPLPIIFLQFSFGFEFITIFVLLLFTQVSIGNVIEPKLMGDTMGLHPVTILFFLAFWGIIWGIPGMFLSVPITATLKIIFSKFDITRPISELFAGEIKLLNIN